MTTDKDDLRWAHFDAIMNTMFAPITDKEKAMPKPTKEDMERRYQTFIDKDGKPFTIGRSTRTCTTSPGIPLTTIC